jgi:hypothetical protein
MIRGMAKRMTQASDAVVWVNHETKQVMVRSHAWGCHSRPHHEWCDPIGAAYSAWQESNDRDRVQLMLETAIDLAMQGFPLGDVLRAFATVPQFRALGSASYPMCRALTQALVGACLEPNTMSFEELLEHHRLPAPA